MQRGFFEAPSCRDPCKPPSATDDSACPLAQIGVARPALIGCQVCLRSLFLQLPLVLAGVIPTLNRWSSMSRTPGFFFETSNRCPSFSTTLLHGALTQSRPTSGGTPPDPRLD